MPNLKAAVAATTAPLIAAALLATAACGIDATAELPTAQTSTQTSTQPTEPGDTAEPGVARVGQWALADDGVRFRVSKLKRTKVGALAAGGHPGDPAVIATVQIDNRSTTRLDLNEVTVLVRLGSDGAEAEAVYQEDIDAGFTGSLPPGRKAQDKYMFAAAAPGDLDNVAVEVTLSYAHDPFTFEGAATR